MKKLDEDSLNRLISEYGNQILRLCYLYLQDYYAAEDVTQETFLRVYEKYDSLKDRSSEKNWIIKIAINLCKNYLKKHHHHIEPLDNHAELNVPDISEIYTRNHAICDQIKKLSGKYREVIILYYYEQISTKEIAQMLNQKETTVLQRLKRAREKLEPLLKEVL